MTMWSGSSKGLITFDNGVFSIQLEVPSEQEAILYEWTQQICEASLHIYFERKGHS